MRKNIATTIATTAITSGLLAFSSVSNAAPAPSLDFTNTVWDGVDGVNTKNINGLTFDAIRNADTISFNASGTDPDSSKAPCTDLHYACDGDGLGINGRGIDNDEIGRGTGTDEDNERLFIGGFNGATINMISFLDLFYEENSGRTENFYEQAFFKVTDMQDGIANYSLSATEKTGENGFAAWAGTLENVKSITFKVNCNKVSAAATQCSDNDYSVAAINVVPVPAAVWLFGSGLIGLVGIARHKGKVA